MKIIIGSCHCGKVSFELATTLESSLKCTCSYCLRRATTMHRLDASQFALLSGETMLGEYGSQHSIKHYFCKNCGINCFTRVNRPMNHSVLVNVGCLEGIENYSLTPTILDEAVLEAE